MREQWRSKPSGGVKKKKDGISREGELPLGNGFTPVVEMEMERKIKSVLAGIKL